MAPRKPVTSRPVGVSNRMRTRGMKELDDITIKAAAGKNAGAFKSVYDHYSPFVWKVVFRTTNGDRDAAASFLRFLSSGGSKPPLELLKEIGIDLETSAPVQDAMSMLLGLVNKLEKMLEN